MDDDFGLDDNLLAALVAAESNHTARQSVQQPKPQRLQQPTPQRLDKPPPSVSGSNVVQPTPQALPKRQTGSSILVSPRQRGNPVLTSIKSMPWEYSDIPADFVLGQGTGALFLSLRYHRLHPEYVYKRIRDLQGGYRLRILLTMVDIPNHEDSLRELSKTSVVNDVTIIACWSAAEAGRYLELYKSYENANFEAIKGKQSSSYAEKLIDFVTVPRSLNKSDAVTLVANFGSLKNAVNANPEQLSSLNGFGGTKVKKWSAAVEEPFRSKKASKRTISRQPGATPSKLDLAVPLSTVPLRDMPGRSTLSTSNNNSSQSKPSTTSAAPKNQFRFNAEPDDGDDDDDDDDEAMMAIAMEQSLRESQALSAQSSTTQTQGAEKEAVSDGIAAALARLRET